MVISMEELQAYVRNQVVGVNPVLVQQENNIYEARELLKQFQKSFSLRQRQHRSDTEILHKINQGLDDYIRNQENVVNHLIAQVNIEVNHAIDEYRSEIISKIDPFKIKERFKTQEDFTDYLNMVNENYKNLMTQSVNQRTINAVKACLHDLEMVVENAIGFFNERESILALNDKFYGSLSAGRQTMIAEAKESALAVSELYHTLSDASEELFLQIWKERDKYDKKIAVMNTLSGGVGGGAGAAAGGIGAAKLITATAGIGKVPLNALIGKAVAAINAGSVAASATLAGGVLVVVGLIVGAVVINSIAKRIYSPMAAGHLEEVTQKCIEEFNTAIEQTKETMQEQISAQIREIFVKEYAVADGYFKEFRMSVNIEEQKIPLLETNLNQVEELLEAVERL